MQQVPAFYAMHQHAGVKHCFAPAIFQRLPNVLAQADRPGKPIYPLSLHRSRIIKKISHVNDYPLDDIGRVKVPLHPEEKSAWLSVPGQGAI